MMIKIEAIVRSEKMEEVKSALDNLQVNGVTVTNVMGYGAQRGAKAEDVYTKSAESHIKPKVKFEVVVSSEEWEKMTIAAIRKAAYTGDYGDGKIFSYEIRTATKIRTNETGYDAVQNQE